MCTSQFYPVRRGWHNTSRQGLQSKTMNYVDLRFRLPSLLAILPLFLHHDIAKQHHLCREDLRNVLWRHEIHNVFLRNMAYVLQNVQFLQWNLTFSLFTWLGSLIFLFYLLVRKTNFLWSVFSKIWMIRFFAMVSSIVLKFSFYSNFYVDVLA